VGIAYVGHAPAWESLEVERLLEHAAHGIRPGVHAGPARGGAQSSSCAAFTIAASG
jgi:hypothetical protein